MSERPNPFPFEQPEPSPLEKALKDAADAAPQKPPERSTMMVSYDNETIPAPPPAGMEKSESERKTFFPESIKEVDEEKKLAATSVSERPTTPPPKPPAELMADVDRVYDQEFGEEAKTPEKKNTTILPPPMEDETKKGGGENAAQ